MKRFSIIPLAFSAVLISACAAKTDVRWLIPELERQDYPAVPADAVTMFRQDRGESVPQDYVRLAEITVSTDGLANLTSALREEAGKLGANAIIVVEDSRTAKLSEEVCQDLEVTGGPGGEAGDLGSGLLGLGCAIDQAAQEREVRAMRVLAVHIPPGG